MAEIDAATTDRADFLVEIAAHLSREHLFLFALLLDAMAETSEAWTTAELREVADVFRPVD